MPLSREDTCALGNSAGAKALWGAFYDLSQIPRMSKHEAAVLSHITALAERHGLRHTRDAFGNVAVFRPGSGGGEGRAPVLVQAHVDMVCEKNDDKQKVVREEQSFVQHDFLSDPIAFEMSAESGWLRAADTTLGADNGIGAAAGIVLMQQPKDKPLPPLEILFTTEEEIGLNGAKALDRGALQLTAQRLVNMDSEEWGEICIGCAGGGHSTMTLPVAAEAAPVGSVVIKVAVSGLMGGHSGLTIGEYRGNAVKCLAQLCQAAHSAAPTVRVASISAGGKHNAIPREASAVLRVQEDAKSTVRAAVEAVADGLNDAYGAKEPGLSVSYTRTHEAGGECLSEKSSSQLLDLLLALPHGVDKMSHVMDGLVETSCNLASATLDDKGSAYTVVVSSRSSVTPSLHALRARIRRIAERCGATVAENELYPGWNPSPNSNLVSLVKDIYKKKFSIEPHLTAIHAGLECGILNDRLGGKLDMVSYGPTIRGAHSPEETAHVESVNTFWELTDELMCALAERD